jgi:hypothetical protein
MMDYTALFPLRLNRAGKVHKEKSTLCHAVGIFAVVDIAIASNCIDPFGMTQKTLRLCG